MTDSINATLVAATPIDCRDAAARLNQRCLCSSVDDACLRQALEGEIGALGAFGMLGVGAVPDVSHAALQKSHPHLFSDTLVYVAESHLRFMARLIDAVERIVAMPAWIERVLAHAPAIARHVPAAAGAFLGYDFHLSERGPQLIEINTNAGGGLLNAKLLRAQRACCEHSSVQLPVSSNVEDDFVAMFRHEWELSRGDRPLRRLAIVDETPAAQFLAPEFALFRRLFEAAGIATMIVDPRELSLARGRLWCEGQEIDLVYNRLTDFSLAEAQNAVLREAWLSDAVVLTPHPHAHALYADKRNLVALSDQVWLRKIGVSGDDCEVLQAGVPRAELVTPESAESFWAERRQWFFKPAAGYGSKATYRGDKLTKRVFGEIACGGYIAQALVPPSERRLRVDGVERSLKLDLRNFVYQGKVQLVSARLYQGQTTNFRTHGGGFAAVMPVA